jgi:hypothetical protein
LNKGKHCVTTKKLKRIRKNKKELEEAFAKENKKFPIIFADLDGSQSVTSLNPTRPKEVYLDE